MCRDALAVWRLEAQEQGFESRAVHMALPLPEGAARLTCMACHASASGTLIVAGMLLRALTPQLYFGSRSNVTNHCWIDNLPTPAALSGWMLCSTFCAPDLSNGVLTPSMRLLCLLHHREARCPRIWYSHL